MNGEGFDSFVAEGNDVKMGDQLLSLTTGLLMGINNILTGKDIFYSGKAFIEVHQNWADLLI